MIQISTIALLAAALATGAAAQDRVVNVFNWSDYIDETILTEFTAETGIKVVYDVFDSNEIVETKLLAGGSGYDIVVPSGSFLQRQITAGVFQKLDKSKLPNLVNMWDAIAAQTVKYDPDNAYSINYMWGTTGIAYNVAKIREILGVDGIDSWAAIFTPETMAKLATCGVIMLDAPEEMFPAALNFLGRDPDSKNADDIAAAAALIKSVRPHIQKFHSSESINALANGDICVAIGYSGDMLQARDRAIEANNGIEIAYVIPKEGAQMWFDQMAIPADAKNVEAAHLFINYIMRPEVAAKASNYVYYANGNLASQPLLNEDVIGDTAIYPDPDTVAKLFVITPLDARTQRLVTRAWTDIKTGS